MKVIGADAERVQVEFGREEILMVNAALNEVCNGISLPEFETRIGATRTRVATLLKEVGLIIDRMNAPRS